MRHCGRCGTRNTNECRFCTGCGSPLTPAGTAQTHTTQTGTAQTVLPSRRPPLPPRPSAPYSTAHDSFTPFLQPPRNTTPRPSVPLPATATTTTTASDGQPAIPKTTDNAATLKYVAVALLLGFLIICVIVAFAFTNKTKIDPSSSSNNTLPELPAGVVGYYSNKDSNKDKCTIYKGFRTYYDTSSCRPKWMANITSDGTLSDVTSGTHYRTKATDDTLGTYGELTRDL